MSSIYWAAARLGQIGEPQWHEGGAIDFQPLHFPAFLLLGCMIECACWHHCDQRMLQQRAGMPPAQLVLAISQPQSGLLVV